MSVVLAAALAAAGTTAVPAHADDGCPCLNVYVDGALTVVHAADVQSSTYLLRDPPWETRSPGGDPSPEPRPRTALSIYGLLKQVNVVPERVSSVTLQGQRSPHETYLDNRDVSLNPAFEPDQHGNPQQPGVWFQGAYVNSMRPLRNDQDVNIKDYMESNAGGFETVRVHVDGRHLPVTVKASTNQTSAGTAVAFAALVEAGAPADATYTWDFGDGHQGTGPAPRHTWAASGTYAVSVQVTASDGSEGSSDPVLIQVGAAPPAGGTTDPGTGTSSQSHPPLGPHRGRGNGSSGTSRPSGGALTTGSPGAAGGSAPGAGGAGTAGTGASTTGRTDGSVASSSATRHRARTRMPERGSRPVRGTLLTEQAAYVARSSPAHVRQAAAAHVVPRTRLPGWLLAVLLLLAALAAGGARQTRLLQRHLPVPAWRRW